MYDDVPIFINHKSSTSLYTCVYIHAASRQKIAPLFERMKSASCSASVITLRMECLLHHALSKPRPKLTVSSPS